MMRQRSVQSLAWALALPRHAVAVEALQAGGLSATVACRLAAAHLAVEGNER